MSLFTEEGFMRDSKKAELAKCITDMYKFDDVIPNIKSDKWRIVVGGMLLHKITWEFGSSFSAILDLYVHHVNGIGEGIDIIFDGYINTILRIIIIEDDILFNQRISSSHRT